jgi:hypothetical protein
VLRLVAAFYFRGRESLIEHVLWRCGRLKIQRMPERPAHFQCGRLVYSVAGQAAS